jgi:hypothetical protein
VRVVFLRLTSGDDLPPRYGDVDEHMKYLAVSATTVWRLDDDVAGSDPVMEPPQAPDALCDYGFDRR